MSCGSISGQQQPTSGAVGCPQVLVPESAADMAEMYRIICDELSHTPISTASRPWMVAQIRGLAGRGAMGVVLGCTEIELLVQQEHVEDVPVRDHSRRVSSLFLVVKPSSSFTSGSFTAGWS